MYNIITKFDRNIHISLHFSTE